jgi:AcrB/AcrD/AcrF family
LACENAILSVEFARELEFQGKGIVEAALEACQLRLRPILMTSVAFIAAWSHWCSRTVVARFNWVGVSGRDKRRKALGHDP